VAEEGKAIIKTWKWGEGGWEVKGMIGRPEKWVLSNGKRPRGSGKEVMKTASATTWLRKAVMKNSSARPITSHSIPHCLIGIPTNLSPPLLLMFIFWALTPCRLIILTAVEMLRHVKYP
jgi:hypothetical protein